MRAEGTWMRAEQSERNKDTDKQERREYERCMTEEIFFLNIPLKRGQNP
jgi:hypothetical protein